LERRNERVVRRFPEVATLVGVAADGVEIFEKRRIFATLEVLEARFEKRICFFLLRAK
jgi:hypothetical protein